MTGSSFLVDFTDPTKKVCILIYTFSDVPNEAQGQPLPSSWPCPSWDPSPWSPCRIHCMETAGTPKQCGWWECKTPDCRRESGSNPYLIPTFPSSPAMMPLGCYHHLPLQYCFSMTRNSHPRGCWARKSSGMELEDAKMSK